MAKGILKPWNDEQGFGFLETDAVEGDVFVHISALRGLSRRPVVGDVVVFDLETDDKGRNRAANATVEGMKAVFLAREIKKPVIKHQRKTPTHVRSNSRKKTYAGQRNSGFNGLIGPVLLIGAVFVAYQSYSQSAFNTSDPTVVDEDSEPAEVPSLKTAASQFRCEGKTRCSQMTSCEEAKFYLNHCPGSVTGGDGDGRPCEDQWCGH